MYVEIEKISEDGLSSTYYEFYVTAEYYKDIPMCLNAYQERERKTRRHGWQVGNKYHRLEVRHSNLERSLIVVPETIITEAISKVASSIVWKDI